MTSQWLTDSVSTFGATCKAKLNGPGEEEAAIRAPLELLLSTAGAQLGLAVVPHDEVRDTDRGVRPDYAISVAGAITGYVEVKNPELTWHVRSAARATIVDVVRGDATPSLLGVGSPILSTLSVWARSGRRSGPTR